MRKALSAAGKFLVMGTWLVLCFCAISQHSMAAKPTAHTGIAATLQSMLNERVSEYIPGIVLLVDTPNGRFLSSAGVSNKGTNKPMPVVAVMPNGSAGKKLTALLVAMLDEEGVVSLDAAISDYLEADILAQIEHPEKMTLRQLLNHTSGIFEYNDAPDYGFFKAQFRACWSLVHIFAAKCM